MSAGTSLTHSRGLPSARSRARPIRHVWKAPVFSERTSVGLDVHARSVVAAAIDGVTGEVFRARLTPAHEDVIGWVRALPGPCAAVSYTHLRAHETRHDLVCRLLLEKKK